MSESFSHHGFEFKYWLVDDKLMRQPWKEYDFHGPVSEWTARDKRPGEMVLAKDGSRYLYYDYKAAVKQALKEEWGCKDNKGKTKRQIAAQAAMEDFERLKAWCNNKWWWATLVVEDQETGDSEYLCGIESDADEDFLLEMAKEQAENLRPMTEFEREVRKAAGE